MVRSFIKFTTNVIFSIKSKPDFLMKPGFDFTLFCRECALEFVVEFRDDSDGVATHGQ